MSYFVDIAIGTLPLGDGSLEHSPERSRDVELPPPLQESSPEERLRPIALEIPPVKLGDPSLERGPPSGSGDNSGLESRRRHCPEKTFYLDIS